jgi:hypothetical protein
MDRDEASALAQHARVARLGTLSKTGRVDLVPITFAIVDDVLYTAVDHKPKTTTELKRLSDSTTYGQTLRSPCSSTSTTMTIGRLCGGSGCAVLPK